MLSFLIVQLEFQFYKKAMYVEFNKRKLWVQNQAPPFIEMTELYRKGKFRL